MKPIDGYDKLRGGYYTPQPIADFITQWAFQAPCSSILEPSCGDGSFLSSIRKIMDYANKQIAIDVVGVELESDEAKKAEQYAFPIINDDFFTYYKHAIEGKKRFDVVVGNPPFIRYQNFDEKYRRIAFELMAEHDFHPNRLTNIWLPFLLLSSEALSENGRIGMVIPAELFQVDYAAEARNYLSSHFDRLTLITFKKLVFDTIQQEIIVLLGEKQSAEKGIRVLELDGLDDLIQGGIPGLEKAETKVLDHSTDKWVKYYLSNEELELLNRLNKDPRITDATNLFEVNVGIVSGENDFFLSSWNEVTARHLEHDITPIISRADQLKGVMLTEDDFSFLRENGKKVYLFTPGDIPIEETSTSAQEYIAWGESQGYNKNYKCRIRKRWYHVPMTWKADAFLIRQANLYPKMIINTAGALVTDTLHKVRFNAGVDGMLVAAAFLNSYTLALSETLGRSYGGGVLTFEPGEMRRIRIPMIGAERLDITKIDALQRQGLYEEILAYTDSVLLSDGLHLTKQEVQCVRSIWKKMCDRRLSRKKTTRRC